MAAKASCAIKTAHLGSSSRPQFPFFHISIVRAARSRGRASSLHPRPIETPFEAPIAWSIHGAQTDGVGESRTKGVRHVILRMSGLHDQFLAESIASMGDPGVLPVRFPLIGGNRQSHGTLVTNLFLSFLQIICVTLRPDMTAVGMLPPGSTHCPAI